MDTEGRGKNPYAHSGVIKIKSGEARRSGRAIVPGEVKEKL
jgi:hypothetical protein